MTKKIYHIVKTLGRMKIVQVESISSDGYYIEALADPSLKTLTIFKKGISQDISLNGWTFPYVINLNYTRGSDVYGGDYSYYARFEVLDPNGQLQNVGKKLYGSTLEYLFKFIFNLSCCKDTNQCYDLYKYVFDNDELKDERFPGRQQTLAIETLSFIKEFENSLKEVKDDEFLLDLKDKIKEAYGIAQGIIANSQCSV